nr:MAG TPA: hypothetical protein [Caudoviricetes sp.]
MFFRKPVLSITPTHLNMSLISLLIIHLARVAFSHIIRTFALATCCAEHFSCNT